MNSKLKHITVVFFMSFIALINLNALKAQDIVNIPDPNFKQALIDHFPVIDTNGDGEISVQEAEAFDGLLDVHNKSIQDLTGLEAFVNIKRLYAADNSISGFVDFSKNTALQRITCNSNNIDSVNVSQNIALTRLDLHSNALSVIDLSANINLERLWVYYNQLKELDLTNNTNLEHLMADNNNLKAIDVSKNVNLLSLGVYFNEIKSLDISNNHLLTVLNAWDNKLTSVNVANGNNANMTIMKVHNNPTLTCIQHDEGFNPASFPCGTTGWCKDDTAMWSTDCSSGIEEVLLNNKVILYPNPAQDNVEIMIEGAILKQVAIYNAQGKQILTSNDYTLNIQDLKAGVYFVKVTTKDGTIVCEKLMKK